MAVNYITRARENRKKALAGLKPDRRQILAVSDYAVHPKAPRRVPVPVFMTSRIPSLFTQANLH